MALRRELLLLLFLRNGAQLGTCQIPTCRRRHLPSAPWSVLCHTKRRWTWLLRVPVWQEGRTAVLQSMQSVFELLKMMEILLRGRLQLVGAGSLAGSGTFFVESQDAVLVTGDFHEPVRLLVVAAGVLGLHADPLERGSAAGAGFVDQLFQSSAAVYPRNLVVGACYLQFKQLKERGPHENGWRVVLLTFRMSPSWFRLDSASNWSDRNPFRTAESPWLEKITETEKKKLSDAFLQICYSWSNEVKLTRNDNQTGPAEV